MTNIICKILDHKYYVVKKFSYVTMCVGCRRCGKFFAMNDEVKVFLEWDGEFSQLYNFNPYDLPENQLKTTDIGTKKTF